MLRSLRSREPRALRLAALVAVGVAVAVATGLAAPTRTLDIAASGCGVQRWSVKTGTDGGAGQVRLGHPTPTSVASLIAQPAPAQAPSNARVAPVETTEWTLDATLVEDKFETDSDYHLVLRDADGRTMIGEIPQPSCVDPSSPFLAGIQHARDEFDMAYRAGDRFSVVNVPVRVSGVGFFDQRHGQTGVAPNGVELHPVLEIAFRPAGSLPSSASPTGGGIAELPTASAAAATADTPSAGSPGAGGASGSSGGQSGGGIGVATAIAIAVLAAVIVSRRGRRRGAAGWRR